MDNVEYPNECIRVLNHGFVRLVDTMGNEDAIVQAARVSYGIGTKTVSEDATLIRYLLRHRHTTPFEMVEFKFHMRLPIFVARQLIRRRTASVNEYSGRYSEMPPLFYAPNPERITKQSNLNKQGSSEELCDNPQAIRDIFQLEQKSAYQSYQANLGLDMSTELARINLPLSTYTEWYWKIDLHNLFHFLKLRLDAHAQYEIRVYAQAIADYVKKHVPVAYQAFEEYILNSIQLNEKEIRILCSMWAGNNISKDVQIAQLTNSRELQEFKDKLAKIMGEK